MPSSKNQQSTSAMGNNDNVDPAAVPSRPAKPFEPEGQFILRLPEMLSQWVRNALNEPRDGLKHRLLIEMSPDTRQSKVSVDGVEFNATLMDLPCIVESHKTFDRKIFYKTGDICQMLVVGNVEDAAAVPTLPEEGKPPAARPDEINKDKAFQLSHGLTPPLKNVRRTRFRKTLKRKDAELQEIENELKRLLRADSEAQNVRWEIVTEEEPLRDHHHHRGLSESLDADGHSLSETGRTSRSWARGTAETDIFGDNISSSDEEREPVDMSEENNVALGFLE